MLSPEGRVLELRLDGPAIVRDTRLPGATPIPAELYRRAHATTLTLRLLDTGAAVTIRPPGTDQLVVMPTRQDASELSYELNEPTG